MQMSGSGLAGAPQGQVELPKALDAIQNRLSALHQQLVAECNRLDNALDRIAPTPKTPPGGADAKAPSPQGYLNRLEMLAGNFEGTINWLAEIANRLDRIA